jgi:TonB family protein
MLALFAAILIPLFPVKYEVLVEVENQNQVFRTIADSFKNIPVVSGEQALEDKFNWQQAVLIIYITGAAIFLFRLLTQTFILVHLMIKYRIKSLNGVRIVENEKYGLPFSFFNVVFINPKFHKQGNLPEILAHEKVHIRENHWFDLLFIELLTVIFWFNPFIWLFEHAIKQNHEYLADKGVLAQGHSVGRYQALLVNQLMGMQIIGVTNNLNFALNTNRLKMMTKKKTSRLLGIKFIWTLPVLAILLYAFAEPSYRARELQPRGNEAVVNNIQEKNTIKLKGVVLDETNSPLPGTSVVIKGTTVGTVADKDGTFELDVPENSSIVLSFAGKKTLEDTYNGVSSGYQEEGFYHRKYQMVDAISTISNNSYDGDYKTTYNGERLAPPPPPPPPTNEAVPAKEKTPSPVKQDEEVFYIVEDMPHFQGGYYAMQDYISKMQQKIAQGKGIKGKAKVLFTVNANGKVTDIKIVEKDNDDAAKGAVMIASEMPDWTPGKQRGKAVPVKYLLPVQFK